MEPVSLQWPTAAFASQIAAYRQAFLQRGDTLAGCGSLARMEEPAEWLEQVRLLSNPETVPPNWVPCTQFLLVRECDKQIVGMIQIRHTFNPYVERYAGHIGYSVHPDFRRKGYATEMLRRVLPYCRSLGLECVLITCAEDNPASRKTILANGGQYESTVFEPKNQVNLERYWIDLYQKDKLP